MKRLLGTLAVLFALGGCASTAPHSPHPKSITTFSSIMLQDPWYEDFVKKYHRKPVLEVINIMPPGLDYASPFNDPAQKIWIDGFLSGMRKNIMKTRRAILVTRSIRETTSLERYFEMQHASSDSDMQPGHVKGADFVLALEPSASMPVHYINPGGWRPFLAGLTLGISELFMHPIYGSVHAEEFTVGVTMHLVDLRTDENVWWADWSLKYNSPDGYTTAGDASTPGYQAQVRKLVGNKWVLQN